jgi:hypothetical protein
MRRHPPPDSSSVTVVPSPRDLLGYMRVVGRGSPVDPPWSVLGQMLHVARNGNAAPGSPLTLDDVMASPMHRDLMTATVAEGDEAPDFELPRLGGDGTVRLSSLLAGGPVALVFGSYT